MKRWWLVALALIAGLIVILLLRRRDHDDARLAPQTGSAAAHTTGSAAHRGGEVTAPVHPAWIGRGMSAKRIAGIVTFEGARVAGATVRLTPWWSSVPEAERTTDATGAFDFGPMPPPGLTISADAPGRVGATQWVELRDPTAKPQPDALELQLLGCAATVTGRILDSSGGPIEKAHVQIAGSRADTDATGAYRVCARLGMARLQVTADGYGGIHLSLLLSGDLARDIVLVPEISVTGRVVRASDGAPVPDAVVTVAPNNAYGPDGPSPVSTISDADGRFRTGGLAPGPLTATATAEDLVTESPAKATVIVGQAPPELTLRMVGTVNVRGKVVMAGQPVAGAKVVAVRKSPLAYSRDAITQTDGSFALDHVPPGDDVFKVTPYEVVKPTSLAITADRDGVVVEVSALASISGRTLRGGKPAPRAHVSARGTGFNGDVFSDGDAHYEIKGLPAGTFDLQADSTDLGAFANPIEVTVAAAEHKNNVDLDIPFGATISGKVLDQDGKAVAGVTVRFIQPDGDLCAATTALDGGYSCASMTGKAAYEAHVYPTWGSDRPFPWAGLPPAPVELADGVAHAENVILRIQNERVGIAGVVVDPNGAPVPDARVRAQAQDKAGQQLFQTWLVLPVATTTADGRFSISDLAAGAYALEARAPDGSEGTVTGVATGTKDAKVTVARAAGIDGTLVGFTETPVVYAQNRRDPSRFVSAQIDGATFSFRGLAPGAYTVTAQSTNEGGAAHVDLAAGATAKVTIASHGRGSITATLVPFKNVGGAPAGLVCHVVLRAGDEAGITNWDATTAPRSDGQGKVTFDPAPAGDVFVQCYDNGGRWSDGAATATLAQSGTVTVQIPVVKNTMPKDAANIGKVGVDFVPQQLGARVATVEKDSPAAKAGIVPGDQIVAVDGTPVDGLTPFGVAVAISNHPIGGTVSVGVLHAGATRTVTLAVVSPK